MSNRTYGYYLKPKHSNARSFGTNAIVKVLELDGTRTAKLFSYRMLVAETVLDIDRPEMKRAVIYGTQSIPTMRHVKEFLKQEGMRADSTNQMLKDYNLLPHM